MDPANADAPEHPVAPSLEEWARMSRAERDAFVEAVNASHSDPVDAMSEGRPHKRATQGAADALSLHFAKLGRAVYVADELAVVYPGQESFVPDILAVVGVEQAADDERQAWVVADEGRGVDLVLEVLHHGNRNKDLVRNVERYARLGIQEYFVYDRRYQRIHGWRLPASGLGPYRQIRPRLARYESLVLGLDLAVAGNRLRFYQAHAELVDSGQLIERLSAMVDDVEARADAAEAALLTAEAARSDAEARAREALEALRGATLAILAARGVAVSDAVGGALAACTDPARLAGIAARAAVVASAEEALSEPAPTTPPTSR